MRQLLILSFSSLLFLGSCTKSNKTELWVYTSLYKDTISDMQPALEKKFPDLKINFFQAGSEEIATKVNAESLAGGIKADVLIASDPFWSEELAQKGVFHSYKPKGFEQVPDGMKSPDGYYATVSIPVMVMIYNSEAVTTPPKTFKEMEDPKWKGKFTTGSPLASGTNFTTVAILQGKYGWDYFKALRKNETISEGGNSSVLRRVQTKERPVGWVLLENVLRFQETDPKIKIIYPEDGSVMQTNQLAIVKKPGSRDAAEKFADWMFSKEGQDFMVKYYMYSPLPGYTAPKGAPALSEITAKAKSWTRESLLDLMKQRENIKEQFTKIMFQ